MEGGLPKQAAHVTSVTHEVTSPDDENTEGAGGGPPKQGVHVCPLPIWHSLAQELISPKKCQFEEKMGETSENTAFDACRITPAVEMQQESNVLLDGGGRGEEAEKTGRDGFRNQLFGFVWEFLHM